MKVVKWAMEKAFSDKLISNRFSSIQPYDERETEGDILGIWIELLFKKNPISEILKMY